MAGLVGTILWAGNDPDHWDHIHVEPPQVFQGWNDGRGDQPPTKNPGPTPGIRAIQEALRQRFGTYPSLGGYYRRTIRDSKNPNSRKWSQHAWYNAEDIGPLYGVEQQRKYYDFLVSLKDGGVKNPESSYSNPTDPTDPTAQVDWGAVADRIGYGEGGFKGIDLNPFSGLADVANRAVTIGLGVALGFAAIVLIAKEYTPVGKGLNLVKNFTKGKGK